jgi:hypothetical protein
MLPQRLMGSLATSAGIAGVALIIASVFGVVAWIATMVATLLAVVAVLARRVI